MRRDFFKRILWLAVAIVHLAVAIPSSHAAVSPGASHLERAVRMAMDGHPSCHDEKQHNVPGDCTGHCLCCCALSACGLIGIPLALGAPPAEAFPAAITPALVEFYPSVEPHPPNLLPYRA